MTPPFTFCTCTDINECSEDTDNCQQNCVNTGGSFTCSCRRGYSLNSDRRTCSSKLRKCVCVCVCVCVCWFDDLCDRNSYLFPPDINECATGVDECAFSEFCRDTVGSYQCGCPAGYRLAADGKTCDGEIKCIA